MTRKVSENPSPRGIYLLGLCLGSLGVVYGDIGTSPLYALRECFQGEHGVPATRANILGVLSLVFWALSIVISGKYLLYVIRADNRGEGGVLALMAFATRGSSRSRWSRRVVISLGLIGAALLYGDGMITPAISVLGAVEGLEVAAPSLAHYVVPIAITVLVMLFLIQKRGTRGVGSIFGPVSLVWFVVLSLLGMRQIISNPGILLALSPTFAVAFFVENHFHGFFVLGAVFLVVTGGEALYADLGHFGPRPIRLSWFVLVLPALLLNYFGQGALLLSDPLAVSNPFYRMAPSWALFPLLLLSTCAAIIASQAIISGAFSLTRQATMLGYLPRMQIQHTSAHQIGQIYVPVVNWMLMLATIGLVLGFGSSSNLAAAYGIAVTTTMVVTTLLAYVVARRQWGWSLSASVALTTALLAVDVSFLVSNAFKIEQGGWFPLVIAGVVMVVMTTWARGRLVLAKRMQEAMVTMDDFFELMRVEPTFRVPGTAVFLARNAKGAPPALLNNFLHNHVVHEHVVLLTIKIEDSPYVSVKRRVTVKHIQKGFVRVVARYGFMEEPDVLAILEHADAQARPTEYTTFFLGNEIVLTERRTGMFRWRVSLFSFLARNATRPTQFFNIPNRRVMEIGSQVSLKALKASR